MKGFYVNDTNKFGYFNDKKFEYFEDHLPDSIYGNEPSEEFFETFSSTMASKCNY